MARLIKEFGPQPISRDGSSEIKRFPLINRLPARVRGWLVSGTLTMVGLTLLAAICGDNQGGDDAKSPSPEPPEPKPEQAIDPDKLSQPFVQSVQMELQQAWEYSAGLSGFHGGFDYILGDIDNSKTWQTLPVLAAADGKACANPKNREGNAVLISHNPPKGSFSETYYGHLATIEPKILAYQCTEGEQVLVSRGEILGMAGATGVRGKNDKGVEVDQPTWIHLHFQVKRNGQLVDPYDLRSVRGDYPNPNFTNDKNCGSNHIWVLCPQVLGTRIGPTPTEAATPVACEPERSKVGCPAPDLTLKTSDGQMVALSDYQGKPTILLLHADWCGPCERELDTLLFYKDQYPELQILTITDAANNLIIQGIAEKTTPVFFWDYTSGPDSLDGKYRPLGLPAAYYIDENWIIQGIRPGLRIGKARERDIDDLVAGRPLFQRPQFESKSFSFPRPSERIYDPQQLAVFGALALYDDKDKAAQILELVDSQIPGSEEDNIAEIVDKLTQAGRIVAGYYCTNGNQVVYEFMRQLANYTSSKAADYAYEGLLDPSYYVNLAEAFNPACPITHFPTD